MAAISKQLIATRAVSELVKRKNWAAREPGVIVVFCIVFIGKSIHLYMMNHPIHEEHPSNMDCFSRCWSPGSVHPQAVRQETGIQVPDLGDDLRLGEEGVGLGDDERERGRSNGP